jgi:hypothetical protein
MTPPDARPPHARTGCAVVAGCGLAMLAGFVAALVALEGFDAPPWVVVPLFFGPVVLYIAGAIVLGLRHARKAAEADPLAAEEAAALRLAGPVVLGFVVVAGLSFGAVFVARRFNAPGWAVPVAFFLPGVLFSVLAWPALRALADRMKRAAPSPERKAAIVAPAAPAHLHPGPAPAAYPAVPPDPTSPGRTLAVQLPPADASPGCACAGVLGFALFWNGIVSVFVGQAAAAAVRGKPEWFLMVFLIPFVLVGLVMIVVAGVMAVGWVVSLLTGKVVVEVDGHPFVPGGTYRGRVTQGGAVRVTRAAVELVCEESATYQAGTSESTATKEVAEVPAGPRDPDAVLPLDFAVTVPADAMHSFAAAKNKINWKLKVYGRVLGFLPYGGAFEVVVTPGAGDGG